MSVKNDRHTCEKRLWSSFAGPGHLHGVGAKYEHLGKWYCKIHHPPTLKAKAIEWDRKCQAEWDAKRVARNKDAAIRKAEQRVLKAAGEHRFGHMSTSALQEAIRELGALGWEPKS